MIHQPGRTIETARLLMRPHVLLDFPASAAMWMDPKITEFIGGRASTREEAWGRIHRYVGHWALLNFGYWAVFEKEHGAFVGEVGFADFMREIEPSLDNKPEMGWIFAQHSQGRGFATEAVTAALAWKHEHFDGATVSCLVHPENEASMRVAERCGFRKVAETEYKGSPTIIFERAAKG